MKGQCCEGGQISAGCYHDNCTGAKDSESNDAKHSGQDFKDKASNNEPQKTSENNK